MAETDTPAANRVHTLNIELDGMSAYLKEVQSRVSQAAAEAKEALLQDRAHLERERRIFEFEKAEIQAKIALWNERITHANEILRIDVGGSKFTTSKSTLMAEKETYFHGLLANSDWAADEDGEFFIDRNPQFFGVILDYLRSVAAKAPEIKLNDLSESEKLQLLGDAEFYQIGSLINCLMERNTDLAMSRNEGLKEEKGKKLENSLRAQIDSSKSEADRLRKIIDCLPSRAQLTDAERRASELSQELDETKKAYERLQEDSVPKSIHNALIKELNNTRSNVSKDAVDRNRPESPAPARHDDAITPRGDRRRAAEIELLRLQLSQSLTHPQTAGKQDEVDRLRQAMGDMVPKVQAEEAAAEAIRLRSLMSGMVPRTDAEAARSEAARLQVNVDTIVPRRRQINGYTFIYVSVELSSRV